MGCLVSELSSHTCAASTLPIRSSYQHPFPDGFKIHHSCLEINVYYSVHHPHAHRKKHRENNRTGSVIQLELKVEVRELDDLSRQASKRDHRGRSQWFVLRILSPSWPCNLYYQRHQVFLSTIFQKVKTRFIRKDKTDWVMSGKQEYKTRAVGECLLLFTSMALLIHLPYLVICFFNSGRARLESCACWCITRTPSMCNESWSKWAQSVRASLAVLETPELFLWSGDGECCQFHTM